MDKELQPKESLQIITQMIEASRQRYADNGKYMILWAVVLIIAAAVNYFLMRSDLSQAELDKWLTLNWIGFPVLGGILSAVIGIKSSKKEYVKTHIGEILKLMWIGFGITLFFTIFFAVSTQNSPIPFVLIQTAFAVYIFALVIRFKPFMFGSLCLLICGGFSFWAGYENQLLLFSIGILCGYLIPGILLQRQFHSKAEKDV